MLAGTTESEGEEEFKTSVGQVWPIIQPIPHRILLETAHNL